MHRIKVFCATGHAFNELHEFAGVKRVGKDTMAALIARNIDTSRVNLHIMSLASTFKKSLGTYYNYKPEEFESNLISKTEPVECFQGLSARYVWERFGTEVVRQMTDSLPDLKINCRDIWIDHIRRAIQWCSLPPITQLTAETFAISHHELMLPRTQIIERFGVSRQQLEDALYERMKEQKLPDPSFHPITDLFLVTDVRSIDEFEAFAEFSPILVDIHRIIPGAKPTGHISDQGIDTFTLSSKTDSVYQINNHDSIETFEQQIVTLLIQQQIPISNRA